MIFNCMNTENIENKSQKFIRLAENRTNKIISMIRLLGNCSNRSAYDYSDKQVQQIFDAIVNEIEEAKKKFMSNSRASGKFRLRDD